MSFPSRIGCEKKKKIQSRTRSELAGLKQQSEHRIAAGSFHFQLTWLRRRPKVLSYSGAEAAACNEQYPPCKQSKLPGNREL